MCIMLTKSDKGKLQLSFFCQNLHSPIFSIRISTTLQMSCQKCPTYSPIYLPKPSDGHSFKKSPWYTYKEPSSLCSLWLQLWSIIKLCDTLTSPESLSLLSSLFSWSSGVRAFRWELLIFFMQYIYTAFCPLTFWVLSVCLQSMLSCDFDSVLQIYCSMIIGWADYMICERWSKKEKDRGITFIEH